MNIIINNPSLKNYEKWTSYLINAAEILIAEDRIMDGVKYLKECQRWAIQRGDGVCLTCGCSLEFMIFLMKYCSPSQVRQVDYLYQEFFPAMISNWFFKQFLVTQRKSMFKRLMEAKSYYYATE